MRSGLLLPKGLTALPPLLLLSGRLNPTQYFWPRLYSLSRGFVFCGLTVAARQTREDRRRLVDPGSLQAGEKLDGAKDFRQARAYSSEGGLETASTTCRTW
jgi:hypothetical protein